MIDLQRIREAAVADMPGPWFIGTRAMTERQFKRRYGSHAEYIETVPPTVAIALVERIEGLERALIDVRNLLPCTCPNPDGSYPHMREHSECAENQLMPIIDKALAGAIRGRGSRTWRKSP